MKSTNDGNEYSRVRRVPAKSPTSVWNNNDTPTTRTTFTDDTNEITRVFENHNNIDNANHQDDPVVAMYDGAGGEEDDVKKIDANANSTNNKYNRNTGKRNNSFRRRHRGNDTRSNAVDPDCDGSSIWSIGNSKKKKKKETATIDMIRSPTSVMDIVSIPFKRAQNNLQQLYHHDASIPSLPYTSNNAVISPPAVRNTPERQHDLKIQPTNDDDTLRLDECRRRIRILKQKQATATAAFNARMHHNHNINECNNTFVEGCDERTTTEQYYHYNYSQRRNAIEIASIYQRMGWIHFRHGRYELSRHLLEYGIDFLLLHHSTSLSKPAAIVAPSTNRTREERHYPTDDNYSCDFDFEFDYEPHTDDDAYTIPFDDPAKYHNVPDDVLLMLAKLYLTQGKMNATLQLWNEVRKSSTNVLELYQHYLERRCQGQQRKEDEELNLTSSAWICVTTRARILLGQCYHLNRHERYGRHRPDIALRWYQDALRILQRQQLLHHACTHTVTLLLLLYHQEVQSQIAETMYHIGNLYESMGQVSLAIQYYNASLCSYQDARNSIVSLIRSTGRRCEEINKNQQINTNSDNDNHVVDSFVSLFHATVADEVTVLEHLGYLYMLGRSYKRSYQIINQALYWTICSLSSSLPVCGSEPKNGTRKHDVDIYNIQNLLIRIENESIRRSK